MEFSGDYATIGEYFQDQPSNTKAAKPVSNDNDINNLDKNISQQNSLFSQIIGVFSSDSDLNKSILFEAEKYQSDIGKSLGKLLNIIKSSGDGGSSSSIFGKTNIFSSLGRTGKVATAASALGLGLKGAASFLEASPSEAMTAKTVAVTPPGVSPSSASMPEELPASGTPASPARDDDSSDNKVVSKIAQTAGSVWKSLSDIAHDSFTDLYQSIPSASELISKVKAGIGDLANFINSIKDKISGLVGDAANSIKEHLPSLDDVKSGVNKAVDTLGDLGNKTINAVTGSKLPTSASKTAMESYLNKALDDQHVTDPTLRTGIAAISIGESGFKPKSEQDYSNTSNERIRQIFSSKLGGKSDAEISAIKKDPEKFFNTVYGGINGNKAADDGYKYRGRGLNQLTGRSNYEHIGKAIGVDLVSNPDLANDPETAAKIAVAYSKERYHGGGFTEIQRSVGNPVATTVARENSAFAEYTQNNRFAPGQDNNASAVTPTGVASANIIDKSSNIIPAATAVASNDRSMPITTPPIIPTVEQPAPLTPPATSATDDDPDDDYTADPPPIENMPAKTLYDDLGLGVNDIPLHINSAGIVVVGSSALY